MRTTLNMTRQESGSCSGYVKSKLSLIELLPVSVHCTHSYDGILESGQAVFPSRPSHIFGIVHNASYATHYNRRLNAGLTLLALCTMPVMQLIITNGCAQFQICISIWGSICLLKTGVSMTFVHPMPIVQRYSTHHLFIEDRCINVISVNRECQF